MRQSLALVSALAGVAFAANDTLEFFFPGGYEGTDPVATVVKADATTTVLDIACPTGTDATDCGFGPGLQYSIISTTIYQATLSEEDEFTMSFTCTNDVKASTMGCEVDMGGSQANDPGSTSAALSGTDISFVTATIVEGAELLSASGSGSAAATAASSGMKTSASATGTAAAGSKSTTGGAQATAASQTGSASPTSTGAAYKFGVEGSALLALAGAAALNAW